MTVGHVSAINMWPYRSRPIMGFSRVDYDHVVVDLKFDGFIDYSGTIQLSDNMGTVSTE